MGLRHRIAVTTGVLAFGTATAAAGASYALRRQAAAAREVIGKPFGEEALFSDRVYKGKYGDPVDLLLLGDSIAAGLGADGPKQTLGAELARRLAKATRRAVRLHTAAVVGAESSDLAGQLAALPGGYRPDVAVIVVGGNDVIHRIRPVDSRRHLGAAVSALRGSGAEVVVGTCPDLGALRALRQPLRGLGSRASRQLAAVQRDVTTELGGRAVGLAEVVGPFFIAQPDEMFSLDRFHPSGAGYRRTAKALLPSVLAALGYAEDVPFGHHPPALVD
ncbi:SGNH/GDSL hydrolase family protein [Nocardioides mangrovi]|uniref:SGNH/GDSL hydrolase family protein n=1 Tax=Nocardioides mangrovi TaxID=2874580 RepID=A0ABS7UAY1_9ACTN|nr:SGNH/GDSL hydrolase family protein [Nocardioides mangrovi]MBZ5738121.1 SGNH/GDSL hydrolase family protein [Nocardioides mangrovi]